MFTFHFQKQVSTLLWGSEFPWFCTKRLLVEEIFIVGDTNCGVCGHFAKKVIPKWPFQNQVSHRLFLKYMWRIWSRWTLTIQQLSITAQGKAKTQKTFFKNNNTDDRRRAIFSTENVEGQLHFNIYVKMHNISLLMWSLTNLSKFRWKHSINFGLYFFLHFENTGLHIINQVTLKVIGIHNKLAKI